MESGENIYEGMVIGEHIRPGDLVVNVIKGKQLTNMRAAGKDDNARIAPQDVFRSRRPWNTFKKTNGSK